MKLLKVFPILAAIVLAAAIDPNVAEAGKKNKKKKKSKATEVQASQVIDVTLSVKSCKKVRTKNGRTKRKCKTKQKPAKCVLGEGGGRIQTKGGKLMFTPFSKIAKAAPKGSKKRQTFAALNKAAKATCGGGSSGGNSLKRYTGQWTAREAVILHQRFAFGASQREIDWSVANGMEKSIERLTTYTPDPVTNARMVDLMCDEYEAGHDKDDPNACDLTDENDISTSGLQLGLLMRAMEGPNPFWERMHFFIYNKFMSARKTAVDKYTRYTYKRHMELIDAMLQRGIDHKWYMFEYSKDPLGHLLALTGAQNIGTAPNEDYAREFWELGTTGTADEDGNPVYTDRDIVQAALAHSGNFMDRYDYKNSNGEDRTKNIAAFSEERHAQGPKTIFAGTPWEAVVYKSADVHAATYKHPQVARYIARNMLTTFAVPNPSRALVNDVADRIRKSDYKLLPVFRELMSSSVIYAASSQNTIMRTYYDAVVGIARTFPGFPIYHWNDDNFWGAREHLQSVQTMPMDAPTVFGFDDDLHSEYNDLNFRNIIEGIFDRGKSLWEDEGYDFHGRHILGSTTATDVIMRHANLLGIPLTPNQIAIYDQFMNFSREECRNDREPGCENGETHHIVRNQFDAHPEAEASKSSSPVLGIIYLLLTDIDFRLL